jgi:predicted GIY-YIG superfamily endonuclease
VSAVWFVYVLKGLKDDELYIGSTNSIHRRLAEHNSGKVESTRYRIPLTLEAYVAVRDQTRAIELERYLKTGSGKAMLRKRIL